MQVWMDQVSQWWNAAVSSGLAQIAGLNLTTIGLTIKAWLGNVNTTKAVGSVATEVAVLKSETDNLKSSTDLIIERLSAMEAKLDALMTGVNGAFMATNIIGQNSSIAVGAKAELATLSAMVAPALQSKQAAENKLAEIANKISTPIGDAEKKLQAKKDELTKQANEQVAKAGEAIKAANDSFFDKFKGVVVETIDSAKESLTPSDKS